MQTLVFNTTTKTTQLWSGIPLDGKSELEYEFANTPTVKVLNSHYEVMMKDGETSVPIFRVPIANTNMLIQK